MHKKYFILVLLITLFVSLIPSRGVAMGDTPSYKAQIKEKYKKIDLSDGVNKEEAVIIAQNYMIEQGENFCKDFVISKPQVLQSPHFPEDWIISFSTSFKFKLKSGLKWNTIYINKKTGEVKYGGEGPS